MSSVQRQPWELISPQEGKPGGADEGTPGKDRPRTTEIYTDVGLIHHWEREIAAFQAGIESAQKRLGEQE